MMMKKKVEGIIKYGGETGCKEEVEGTCMSVCL